MNIKSNKGIAMISLVIYVSSFLIIAALVGTISTYFYNNMQVINNSVGANAEYNKLNLYMLHFIKSKELESIKLQYADETKNSSYIVFTTLNSDGLEEKHWLIKPENSDSIYFDYSLLCSNVEDFKIRKANENGKDYYIVTVKIGDTAFSTRYVRS